MQKFHAKSLRRPKFKVKRASPKVATRVLFAAYKTRGSGFAFVLGLDGRIEMSEPVSIRNTLPDIRSLMWRRLDLTPMPTVSTCRGVSSFPSYVVLAEPRSTVECTFWHFCRTLSDTENVLHGCGFSKGYVVFWSRKPTLHVRNLDNLKCQVLFLIRLFPQPALRFDSRLPDR